MRSSLHRCLQRHGIASGKHVFFGAGVSSIDRSGALA
jgi:hypothetical protein